LECCKNYNPPEEKRRKDETGAKVQLKKTGPWIIFT